MKRLHLVSAATLLVCFACMSISSASTKKDGVRTQRVKVRTLTSSRLPISFGYATATTVGEQTVLSYSTANNSGAQVSSIGIVAFTIDKLGRIRGGQGIVTEVDLSANSTDESVLIFDHKVNPGERLALAVWRVSGAFGNLEANSTELVEAVKSETLSRVSDSTRSHSVKVAFPLAATFCEGALELAKGACGGAGTIQSFSCDEKNQSFSFTCKGGPAPTLE